MPHRLLFPLAALFALSAVPLWLLSRFTSAVTLDAAWHGHEMLFGFAFAVIAGFLSTRPTRTAAWTLAGTWMAARIATATGSGPLALLVGLSFPAAALVVTTPPLFKGAKRWENRILPVIVTALLLVDTAWWSGRVWFGPQVQTAALLVTIDLTALLLLIIGGRALRAAAGGHIERQGLERRDRVQRRYELPLAALVGGAAVLDAFAFGQAAGALCIGAAVLTLLRVIPWQLHRTFTQPALWSLALGYLWLVPGLAVKGIAQFGGYMPVSEMLHGIGIGALGTLTLVMMARTALLRARKPVANLGDIGIAALLVSLAALARLIAAFIPAAQHDLLWLAAIAWACAFLILLVRLLRTSP
jgi:uncharacterized protein involved in response to NO